MTDSAGSGGKPRFSTVLPMLRRAMLADYIVVGGGSITRLEEMPDGVRRGHNRSVVEGGRRLWQELPDPATHAECWTVV